MNKVNKNISIVIYNNSDERPFSVHRIVFSEVPGSEKNKYIELTCCLTELPYLDIIKDELDFFSFNTIELIFHTANVYTESAKNKFLKYSLMYNLQIKEKQPGLNLFGFIIDESTGNYIPIMYCTEYDRDQQYIELFGSSAKIEPGNEKEEEEHTKFIISVTGQEYNMIYSLFKYGERREQ